MCLALVVCTLCACGDPTDFSDGEKLSKDYTRSTDPAESYNYNDGATSAPLSYNVYASSVSNFELRLFRNYFAQKSDKTKSSVFALPQRHFSFHFLQTVQRATHRTKSDLHSARI